MSDIKKITIILIRVQAFGFILLAIMQWGIIATLILLASLRETPNVIANYEYLLISSIFYLVIGIILYARSESLASHFISSVQNSK
jgi:hypothetical protein